MRIAQVAPLAESVPPARYGGTERVVAYLTEALLDLGHEVTLFASGDSRTRARLVAPCARAMRLDPSCRDTFARLVLLLELVLQRAHRFDVVHFHVDHLHFPTLRRTRGLPHVTTMHGRLDRPETVDVLHAFSDMPLVSISDDQRRPVPEACWAATIHHGLPVGLYRPGAGQGGYLLFLGRISPEKGADRAIEIAGRVGLPLKLAAKIDAQDRAYWRDRIEPLLRRSPNAEFLGEIDDAAKQALLGDALALVFPIDWPEPFGLVLIEAMACGTPVIAWRRGAVPEVVDEGVTGFVVESIEQAVQAVGCLAGFDRARCRARFEARFTDARMAADHVTVYRRLIAGGATEAA